MPDDPELLRRYVADHSQEAFAELVRQHLNLVYFASLRRVGGDVQLAEDVCQQVFVALARNAASLVHRSTLTGWLYTTSRFAAARIVRGERRRRTREWEAQAMLEIDSASADWDQLKPVLDTAMDELDERDREAVLLRFFEGRTFAAVGEKLRVTEDAARMRVERALGKLRAELGRRGVSSTAAALSMSLANHAVAVAPAGLSATVATAAVNSGGWGAISQVLTWTKINSGVVGLIVAAGVVAGVIETRTHLVLANERVALQANHEEVGQLRTENQRLHAALDKLDGRNPELGKLAILRARLARLKARPPGVIDSAMQPAATWRNAGLATPQAALETLLWAESVHDQTVHNQVHRRLPPESQAAVAAFFATLSDAARTKFITPHHWLETVLSNLSQDPADPAVAYQVTGQENHDGPDEVRISYWMQHASGDESDGSTLFQRFPDGWHRKAKTNGWQDVFPRIDPATGEFRRPAK